MLTSVWAVSTPVAAADECPLRGGTRFYGGTHVERPLRLPEGHAKSTLTWRLAVNRTTVATGTCPLDPAAPRVQIEVPVVERRIEALLVLTTGEGGRWTVPVELHPPETALAAAFGKDPVGWVGEVSPLRVAGRAFELPRVALASPGAVRRFRGPLLVVPPGTPVGRTLAAALLHRAASGASVLALGGDDAPWVEAEIGGETPAPTRSDPLFAGLEGGQLGDWGRGGRPWTRRLRAPEGNHAEWAPGRVRALYPGRGQLVLVQLALLPHLDDEPLAAELLTRLLRRVHAGPPPLAAPRSRTAAPGVAEADAALASAAEILGDERGEGPAVVVTGGRDREAVFAKAASPVVVLGSDGSLFVSGSDRLPGPGLDARGKESHAELLRFLTAAGLRVETDRYWR